MICRYVRGISGSLPAVLLFLGLPASQAFRHISQILFHSRPSCRGCGYDIDPSAQHGQRRRQVSITPRSSYVSRTLTNFSIPTRRELVKNAARNPTASELKETQKEAQAHRWSTCSVSNAPLRRPVVSDSTGVLYNKDAILQYLLPAEATTIDKDEYSKILQGRIKSLKDVVEVLFETDADQKDPGVRWICPVTSKELGPAVKAVYLVPCGHAFSQEAIKEMKSEQCLQCNQSYEAGNIIPILPIGKEESVFLDNRMERLAAAGLTHSLKKAPGSGKKRKANGDVKSEVKIEDAEPEKVMVAEATAPSPVPRAATPQSGVSTPKVSHGIKDAATASLTAKVLEEEEAKKKRRKMMGENETLKSLFSKSGGGPKHKDGDFMTRGYSIPANARHQ